MTCLFLATGCNAMQKLKPIKALLDMPGKALRDIAQARTRRAEILAEVLRHLEEPLRTQVMSAGLARGRLTLGVTNAAWASRLRYRTAALRALVSAACGEPIARVRIRVLPPGELPPPLEDAVAVSRAPPPGRKK